MQWVITRIVLRCFSFLPWYWLNTEKYALLYKLKAIKTIPYMEQEAQNSRAPREQIPEAAQVTTWQGTALGNTEVMHVNGKFLSSQKQ